MRVLVVDDSVLFRSLIRKALEQVAGVTVVGTASSGGIAIRMAREREIDLVTLDLEMPEMNGIETLKQLRAEHPGLRVLVFAGQSPSAARAAVDALRFGAEDFVFKPVATELSPEEAPQRILAQLEPRLRGSKPRVRLGGPQTIPQWATPEIVVVGSSTGGPKALEQFFARLKAPLKVPVLVAQHMPAGFTADLARHLGEIAGVPCREAVDGELLRAGEILIAPGDRHLRITGTRIAPRVAVTDDERRNGVRPAVDHLFESAVDVFGGRSLAFILTGMGNDGCEGALRLRAAGGKVMIQDEESSVVWGMPGAIFRASAFDGMGDLAYCAGVLAKAVA